MHGKRYFSFSFPFSLLSLYSFPAPLLSFSLSHSLVFFYLISPLLKKKDNFGEELKNVPPPKIVTAPSPLSWLLDLDSIHLGTICS